LKLCSLWLSASALALGFGSVANAQSATSQPKTNASTSTVAEVVVTAERRATNLQKTAVAATVLTQKDLTQRGVFTVDQLQFVSPSLTVNNFGQGNDFDIRGIGKGEHNTQTGTGVITYRDGVATFPGYFQEEPYYDEANVQILRGPQGTFSGQNATGGAVLVNSQDPIIDGGYSGYVKAHYGNYDDTGVEGAVNLPISDTLAARIAVNTDYHKTYYDTYGPLTGNPNTKWASTRFSLLWTPDSSWKVLFKTDYNYLDNGAYLGPPATDYNSNDLFHFGDNARTYALDQGIRSVLQIDYVNPAGITFRSISGFQKGRSAWKADIDGTDLPAPNYTIDEAVDETLWSEEFNIISPNKGPVTWIAGAYYQHNYYDFPQGQFDIGVPPGVVDENLYGVNATFTAAVFGQVSFNLPDGFQLQLGGRYSRWGTTNDVTYYVPEYYLYYPQPNASEYGGNFTGKATLNWNINDNNFLYAFVASGAKPGGINTAIYFGSGPIPGPFGQEYVVDYEVGWKSSLFDNHLHTQIGFYYNNFRNFQVILPLPDNPVQTTEQNDPNPTKLYGFEASAQAVFGDFSMNAGLGLEHTSLGTFYAEDSREPTSGICNALTGGTTAACIDLAGHPQTYAPSTTFNISGQYDFHLASGDIVTPNLNFSHISSQWATLFDNYAAGDFLAPRNILGASLAWKHGTYTTTLYGYNLTNDQYVSAVLTPIKVAGEPRLFGVSVMKTF
jgi:iron complex outermembrane recepter protein